MKLAIMSGSTVSKKLAISPRSPMTLLSSVAE